MRRTIEEIWLRLVRLYTYNTPINKGKYRVFQVALSFCKLKHESLRGRSRDGRQFSVNLTSGMQEHVFFFGEYEKMLSRIAASLIGHGDICVDAGANFGWYTTLMAKGCGPDGEVHAFEPVPQSFHELSKNYALLGSPVNVFINRIALGDKEDVITINVFDGEPTGHASIADKRDAATSPYDCRMSTLDSYLEEHSVHKVNFVKVDIEGAEMLFLRGAERLFKQEKPPIFLMEMALEQTRHFGYLPNDLINFIGSRGDYEFYAADEIRNKLRRIDGFADDDVGANVFCIPCGFMPTSILDLVEN